MPINSKDHVKSIGDLYTKCRLQVCACERIESDGGTCIAAKEPKIGTTLHLFYREHQRKALRSAAGKYGPPLLKGEMSNRWLATCPPAPLMLRAPGRKLTQLLWSNPDRHTQTTEEALLLLGQDETDPEGKSCCCLFRGMGRRCSCPLTLTSPVQSKHCNVAPSTGEVTEAQSSRATCTAEIPSHHSGFVRALTDCLALDGIFSVEPYRLL